MLTAYSCAGHALLLIGKLLQRPKMPSFAVRRLSDAPLASARHPLNRASVVVHVHPHIDVDGVSCLGMLPMQDITAPSVSWMLVDMLTWPAKPSSASSTISAHSNSAVEDCRSVQCTLATDTDSAALESPTGQPQHASELQQTTERSSHRSRVSGDPGSAGHQQKLSERIARNGKRRVCKVERRMAGDVHIVRPSALRRSASCPEAAAQPGAGELLLAQHSSRLS